MNEYVIERYETFNTKGCPEELIFGDFNNQTTPYTYSGLTNNYDGDGNPIDADLADKELVEDAIVKNDENNNEKSLASDIDPPHKRYSGN